MIGGCAFREGTGALGMIDIVIGVAIGDMVGEAIGDEIGEMI